MRNVVVEKEKSCRNEESKQSFKQSVDEMIDLRDNGGELNGEGSETHAAHDMIMECPIEESMMDVIKSRKAKKRAKKARKEEAQVRKVENDLFFLI